MSDTPFTVQRAAAYTLVLLAILAALVFHVVPALLAGLLSFSLTQALLKLFNRWDSNRKLLSHGLLSGLVVGVVSLGALASASFLVARFLAGESLQNFMLTLSETVSHAKHFFPASIAAYIPDSLLEMRGLVAKTLKAHADTLAGVGSHVLESLVLTLIGWITGVLAALSLTRAAPRENDDAPRFHATWHRLWSQLTSSFRNVAWAQTKIAGINALLTGIFLLAIMPIIGWHVPYAKTLILATLVFGLIPVVGNLLSNSLICILALGVAFPAAVVSLVFLVVAHKLEYFLNARIQGHEIGAKSWEILILLFAFERLFGPAGMVAAPIIYAFIKADLKRAKWLA
ncbi:TPA: AI-2E family transporter [Burkholderia vietnamiensis]|nr:AI-2E family transporter [Burkholderia vietnamiensis]